MIHYQIRLFAFLLIPSFSISQKIPNDSVYIQSQVKTPDQVYFNTIGGSSLLYNGSEYTASYPEVSGFPFFGSEALHPGNISYDHIIYQNIPIAYDLVANEVVIKGYQGLNIKLLNERIDSFLVLDHLFINLALDTSNDHSPEPGFYDLVYNGTIKVLIKRRKQVERAFRTEDPFHFTQYNNYYIKRGMNYIRIDKKRNLMSLFRDRNKELNTYYKANKLNFKKDPEKAIVMIASWYDQLKK